jgi:hypothetical protein
VAGPRHGVGVPTWLCLRRAGRLPAPMFVMDHLESSRRGDVIWIPPQSLRGSRDSGAIAETLNELGLAKGTIG